MNLIPTPSFSILPMAFSSLEPAPKSPTMSSCSFLLGWASAEGKQMTWREKRCISAWLTLSSLWRISTSKSCGVCACAMLLEGQFRKDRISSDQRPFDNKLWWLLRKALAQNQELSWTLVLQALQDIKDPLFFLHCQSGIETRTSSDYMCFCRTTRACYEKHCSWSYIKISSNNCVSGGFSG